MHDAEVVRRNRRTLRDGREHFYDNELNVARRQRREQAF